jgi:hypothetical protein
MTLISGPLAAGGTAPFSPDIPNGEALWTSTTSGLSYDGSAYTLEGWLLPIAPNGRDNAWIAYGLPGAANWIGADLESFSPAGLGMWKPVNWKPFPSVSLNYGLWNYVAMCDDAAGTFTYYTNGTLQAAISTGTSNGVSYNTSSVLYLGDPGSIGGSDPAPSRFMYYGGLSNMAIYSVALTAAQVAAHYAAAFAVARNARRHAYVTQ